MWNLSEKVKQFDWFVFSPSEIYAKKDGGHIGLNYYKAVFREYNDTSFKHPKQRGPDEVHLGLLGPVIRTEVGDVVAVTLHNNADRSYSIHPHGAVLLKMYEGALYNDSDPSEHNLSISSPRYFANSKSYTPSPQKTTPLQTNQPRFAF